MVKISSKRKIWKIYITNKSKIKICLNNKILDILTTNFLRRIKILQLYSKLVFECIQKIILISNGNRMVTYLILEWNAIDYKKIIRNKFFLIDKILIGIWIEE